MTYKTGTIGEFMKWTKRVVTDPAAEGYAQALVRQRRDRRACARNDGLGRSDGETFVRREPGAARVDWTGAAGIHSCSRRALSSQGIQLVAHAEEASRGWHHRIRERRRTYARAASGRAARNARSRSHGAWQRRLRATAGSPLIRHTLRCGGLD